MKYIVIVPDGMADNPIAELGNKTPLEVARTTNLDYMTKHGCLGIITTIPKGMAPGSDVGNMSLLGYNPKEHLTGRAPLEAANMGIDIAEDEIAFRCNLVTVTNGKMEDYSAGHISTKEAAPLIEELNKKLNLENVKFYVGKSYRHLLILKVRHPQTFLEIKTTPPHDILGKDIKSYLPEGEESEMLLKLMEHSKTFFENHPINQVRIDLNENPANMIWLWGQGTQMNLEPFKKKFGVDGAIISAVDLVNGLGKLAGLKVITVPGATGYYDTNYKGKAEYALAALKKHDFVFIHIEAPDEAGHNGDYKAKVEAIEHIDKDIVGPILNHFDEHDDVRILVLPDHPTPVEVRTHTSDPVGLLMYGKGITPDGSLEFTEKACEAKNLRFQTGEDLLRHFFNKYL
jgi:2,3-bisphosphoglycerate-independent phosphoglycerate mutase